MEKKYKLPREFGEKWVEALRSGEYQQGSSCLKDSRNNYCCLGVACVVAGIDPPAKDWILPEFANKEIPKILIGSGAVSDLVYDCSSMNDHENKTFPEIADWICDNVEFVGTP